jgi:pimeloyl-ACP methyl ester carboxylesterase
LFSPIRSRAVLREECVGSKSDTLLDTEDCREAARLPRKKTPGFQRQVKLGWAQGLIRLSCCLLLQTATLLWPVQSIAQADYAREKRWAEEITPAIVAGDPVQLELKSGRRFLAIYTQGRKATGSVILVHGLGVHPDWGLIGTLRTFLPDEGYDTLSVQMPVLAADAPAEQYPPLFPEAAERLATAVAFLRGRGAEKVAIVSHSMGSRMTSYFLSHTGDARVDAWVAIGLSTFATGPSALKVPALDLYGEKDQAAVLANAPQRAAVLRGIRGSAQVEAAGADHFFTGQDAVLLRHVRLFLDRRLK